MSQAVGNPAFPLALMDWWDVAISMGMFASVVCFVLAAFSQRGTARLSPQREVAIATGHTDRRTMFERPVIGQFMWLLLAVTHSMAAPRAKRWLQKTLVAAGSPNYFTPEEYLAVALLNGLLLGGLLGLGNLLVYDSFSLVALLAGLVLGFGLTVYQMHDRAVKRVRLIGKRLPYALDLIALAMGAGATFTEAVRTLVRNTSDVDPFLVELKAVLAEIELGTTRRKALQNLAERVPLDLLQSIVASVVQAEELGTPLGDVLRDQATLLRLQRSVRAENAAAVASVRMLVPCLLLVMAVILAVFGPAIVKTVRGGLF